MRTLLRGGIAAAAALAAVAFTTQTVHAHGFAGDRFFPPTITTDDPFAADELAFPTLSLTQSSASDDSPRSKEVDAGFEFDKLIIPHLAIGVSDDYAWTKPYQQPSIKGWDNLEVNAKYEFYVNDPHELIISAGLVVDVGSTGTEHAGADSFSTFSPTLYFGKGFGDLPDSMRYFKPLALTGTLDESFPQKAEAPNTFDYGFALEYNIPYLQQHVMNMGIPAPFKDMIPLIEYAGSTTENRGPSLTTGTINPGVLFETKYCQFGMEAIIPINSESGSHVGAIFQVWWYLDDIAPKLFGHPLFGGE